MRNLKVKFDGKLVH
jgi:hypothetical protein